MVDFVSKSKSYDDSSIFDCNSSYDDEEVVTCHHQQRTQERSVARRIMIAVIKSDIISHLIMAGHYIQQLERQVWYQPYGLIIFYQYQPWPRLKLMKLFLDLSRSVSTSFVSLSLSSVNPSYLCMERIQLTLEPPGRYILWTTTKDFIHIQKSTYFASIVDTLVFWINDQWWTEIYREIK